MPNDEKLSEFVNESEDALDVMLKAEAVLIMREIIADSGVTELESTIEDLTEKGISSEIIPDIVDKVEIKGVTLKWTTEEAKTLAISVDKDKYEGGEKLKVGKEFDHVEGDYFILPTQAPIIEHLIREGHNILLIGPAGCGKTQMLEIIAKDKLGRKVLPFNMTEETTTDDLVGQISLKESKNGGVETVFNDGPLTLAMRNGWIFQIDELDVAEQGVLFQLQRVLEGKDLILSKNGGEKVEPHEDFALVATSNTAGRGDQADIYKARQILDEAFLDRWGAVFRINYISEVDEIKVLRRRTGLGQREAKLITKIAKNARTSFGREVLTTFSLRKSIQFAQIMSYGYSMVEAFKVAVLNKATDEDAEALSEIFQRITGEKINLSERFMGENTSQGTDAF